MSNRAAANRTRAVLWTRERRRTLALLWLDGARLEEIGAACGCSRVVAWRAAQDMRLPDRVQHRAAGRIVVPGAAAEAWWRDIAPSFGIGGSGSSAADAAGRVPGTGGFFPETRPGGAPTLPGHFVGEEASARKGLHGTGAILTGDVSCLHQCIPATSFKGAA